MGTVGSSVVSDHGVNDSAEFLAAWDGGFK